VRAALQLAPAVGGAIAAFRLDDMDVLRPTSPAALAAGDVRAFACYPLVPYSNRIANAQLSWEGIDYPLARNFGDHPHSIHGVGWQRAWTVGASSARSVTLHLAHDPGRDGADAWPFAFAAHQHFTVDVTAGSAILNVRLTIENHSARAFPFGLGWHPFFRKTPATTLRFGAAGAWRNDRTQLPQEHVAIPPAWRCHTARAPPARLDNVFTRWAGEAALGGGAGNMVTTLVADTACNHLVVYVPDGPDYLAVEPVTHMTDAFNRAARGAAQTGTRVLSPGGAFSCTMRIIATPSPPG
jgi:aldose 1-epimerase